MGWIGRTLDDNAHLLLATDSAESHTVLKNRLRSERSGKHDFRHIYGRSSCVKMPIVWVNDLVSQRKHQGMRWSGMLIWFFLGLPAIDPSTRKGDEIPISWIWWLFCFFCLGIAYFFGSTNRRLPSWARLAALGIQSLSVVAMTLLFRNYFNGLLLVLVVWQLALYVDERTTIAWSLIQTAVVIAALEPHWHMGWRWAMSSCLVGLEIFAFVAGRLLAQEAAARDELLLLSVELGSTRELLKESTRVSERLHIARELHDVLGHHLTALSLQLEHAVHITAGDAKQEVERAQTSTRQMLSDVRGIVDNMRTEAGLDLAPALNSLKQRIVRPQLHLDVPPQFSVQDGSRAHAVLRCVQEIVTNTIKHSGADNLWITINLKDEVIEVSAQDDGNAQSTPRAGAGLSGMRERFESFGGRVEFRSQPDLGFSVSAWLPLQRQDRLA